MRIYGRHTCKRFSSYLITVYWPNKWPWSSQQCLLFTGIHCLCGFCNKAACGCLCLEYELCTWAWGQLVGPAGSGWSAGWWKASWSTPASDTFLQRFLHRVRCCFPVYKSVKYINDKNTGTKLIFFAFLCIFSCHNDKGRGKGQHFCKTYFYVDLTLFFLDFLYSFLSAVEFFPFPTPPPIPKTLFHWAILCNKPFIGTKRRPEPCEMADSDPENILGHNLVCH
jgi:hypothetical protein